MSSKQTQDMNLNFYTVIYITFLQSCYLLADADPYDPLNIYGQRCKSNSDCKSSIELKCVMYTTDLEKTCRCPDIGLEFQSNRCRLRATQVCSLQRNKDPGCVSHAKCEPIRSRRRRRQTGGQGEYTTGQCTCDYGYYRDHNNLCNNGANLYVNFGFVFLLAICSYLYVI